MDRPKVSIMDYDQGNLRELELQRVADGERFKRGTTSPGSMLTSA
jgi:hypothetical protein